jgi:hypothetical protein
MRLSTVLVLLASLSSSLGAGATLECTHYVYSGVPFVTIKMTMDEDGHIQRLADLTHYGNTQQIAVVENPTRDDELYHLTVDADRPGQELYLEIYKQGDAAFSASYNAKLINPQSPAMKEMLGNCADER